MTQKIYSPKHPIWVKVQSQQTKPSECETFAGSKTAVTTLCSEPLMKDKVADTSKLREKEK